MAAACFFTEIQAVLTSGRKPVGGSSEYCAATEQGGPLSGPAALRSPLACLSVVVGVAVVGVVADADDEPEEERDVRVEVDVRLVAVAADAEEGADT